MPIARYIDWMTTTPLMLYEVCHLGGASTSTMMIIVGCVVCIAGIAVGLIGEGGAKRLDV